MIIQRPQKEIPWILVMMMIEAFSVLPSTPFPSSSGLCQPAKMPVTRKSHQVIFTTNI
jgi:hypothetical protein